MNVGGSKLPFSEAPSFLTSRIMAYIPVLTSRALMVNLCCVRDHAYKYYCVRVCAVYIVLVSLLLIEFNSVTSVIIIIKLQNVARRYCMSLREA